MVFKALKCKDLQNDKGSPGISMIIKYQYLNKQQNIMISVNAKKNILKDHNYVSFIRMNYNQVLVLAYKNKLDFY